MNMIKKVCKINAGTEMCASKDDLVERTIGPYQKGTAGTYIYLGKTFKPTPGFSLLL